MVGGQKCPRRGREGVAGGRVRARTCFIHVCAPAGTRCVWSNIAADSAHQSSLLPATTTETERDAQRRAHARLPSPAPAASRARLPRAARRAARPTRIRLPPARPRYAASAPRREFDKYSQYSWQLALLTRILNSDAQTPALSCPSARRRRDARGLVGYETTVPRRRVEYVEYVNTSTHERTT